MDVDASAAPRDTAGWPAGTASFGRHRLNFDLFPWALLRTPGLPADTIAEMAAPAAFTAATELLSDDTLETLAAEFESVHLPRAYASAAGHRADSARLTRARRTVARRSPLASAQAETWARYGDADWAHRWQRATDEFGARVASAEQAYEEALRAGRRYLARRCSHTDVAHAIFLSGREFYDNAFVHHIRPESAERTGTRVRQSFATAGRYLRRMSVRCELTSFFGPVHFVRLDAAEPAPLRLATPVPERVFVEPSVWLINELHQRIQRKVPLPERRPRRSPLVVASGDRLIRLVDGASVPVSWHALALWRALDGRRTVREAAAAAGIEMAMAKPLLRELAGTVVPVAELPAHTLRPFDQVVAADEPAGPASEVARLARTFAETGWPDRAKAFTEAERLVAGLGVEERRGKGEHYSDRYVFHEERSHPLSARTTLGGAAVAGLTDALADILPLSFLAGLLDREDARQAVRAVIGDRPTRLVELLRAEIPPVSTRGDAFRSALRELVLSRTRSGTAALRRTDVDDLVTRFLPALSTRDSYGTVAGPDMMVLGDPATAAWLLSELHDDGSYLGGGVTRLHPDGDRVRLDLLDGVARLLDPATMAPVVSKRRNMFLVPELPGTAIELSGLSEKPREQTVPISEVLVAQDGDAVLIGDRRFRLYTGDIPSIAHRALAVPSLTPVPIDCGAHTPRVTVGSTVVQRARWRLTAQQWDTGFRGWLALHESRRRLGLPRRVFVRHPREQKPLYLDFADPYSVEDIVRLPPATITVSEMLPDPDHLWWDDGRGLQCAELRIACFVSLVNDP